MLEKTRELINISPQTKTNPKPKVFFTPMTRLDRGPRWTRESRNREPGLSAKKRVCKCGVMLTPPRRFELKLELYHSWGSFLLKYCMMLNISANIWMCNVKYWPFPYLRTNDAYLTVNGVFCDFLIITICYFIQRIGWAHRIYIKYKIYFLKYGHQW